MTNPVLANLHLIPDTQIVRADFSDDSHFLIPIREPHDHTATAYALRTLADYITNLPNHENKTTR